MAKEIAIGKRAKITEAQQYMLLSVLGASVVLGIAIALISHFIQKISFNARVIAAEEKTIVAYSDVIKSIGVCAKPKGSIYSNEELEKCDPNNINISDLEGTLRYNILEKMAANQALNSVPKEDDKSCRKPGSEKNYTYEELSNLYNKASDANQLQEASQLIKKCSALRIIPDSLPAFKNEEALLASLNKLFNLSGWEPENISPSGSTATSASAEGVNTISVNLSVEADTGTTMTVLNNIERSIREFNIERAIISWENDNTLSLSAQATAFYMDPSAIKESTETISAEDKK